MAEEPTASGIPQRGPAEAWESLRDGRAALVDVRTRAEWTFVGVPDLSEAGTEPLMLEWKRWPDMAVDPDFADRLLAALPDPAPSEMLFLCRSGGRSQEAAEAVQAAADASGRELRCVNVAEGFEGDLGPDGHRSVNGWKSRGLPWRQS